MCYYRLRQIERVECRSKGDESPEQSCPYLSLLDLLFYIFPGTVLASLALLQASYRSKYHLHQNRLSQPLPMDISSETLRKPHQYQNAWFFLESCSILLGQTPLGSIHNVLHFLSVSLTCLKNLPPHPWSCYLHCHSAEGE